MSLENQFNLLAIIPLLTLMILSYPTALEGFESIQEIINTGFTKVVFSIENMKTAGFN